MHAASECFRIEECLAPSKGTLGDAPLCRRGKAGNVWGKAEFRQWDLKYEQGSQSYAFGRA